MKENRLNVRINRPASQVFAFAINPENTPQWIDSLVAESIDTPEIGLGTTYVNVDENGNRGSYVVSEFERDKIFQLNSTNSSYRVRYSCTSISEQETELEYFEWMEEGDLEKPFAQNALDKFKALLEAR